VLDGAVDATLPGIPQSGAGRRLVGAVEGEQHAAIDGVGAPVRMTASSCSSGRSERFGVRTTRGLLNDDQRSGEITAPQGGVTLGSLWQG